MTVDKACGSYLDLSSIAAEILSQEDASVKKSRNKYDIVSAAAYLMGVHKNSFGEDDGLLLCVFEKLDSEKAARIMRNLCITRTHTIRHFKKICQGIQRDNRTIIGMPEYVSEDTLKALDEDGVDIYKSLADPEGFLFNINANIQNRINNCKDLFPDFLNWNYVKELFVVPRGTTTQGTKAAAEKYYANYDSYPYHQFINWDAKDDGNILYCDSKFVTLLYERHNDEFRNLNLVSDVGEDTKLNVYSFIEESKKCIFVVDCENSDPYNLAAAINNLEKDKLSKIEKIILFDDKNAASAWELLSSFVSIPVEYILIRRIKEEKSLADIKVAARISKEYYMGGVDSFVLVSSDSDFWGLIEEMEQTRFLVMVEHEKCSPVLKQALHDKNIFYCYIDSFYAGGGDEIRSAAITKEIESVFDGCLNINLKELMGRVLHHTRIKMSPEEEERFIKKKLRKNLFLDISDDGDIRIVYKDRK